MFKLGQHNRDEQLMIKLVEFLGCGNVCKVNEAGINVIVTRFTDLTKVIAFFEKYPLQGAKSFDLADFSKIAILMQNKAHLTAEGLDQIRKIKDGMNKGPAREFIN